MYDPGVAVEGLVSLIQPKYVSTIIALGIMIGSSVRAAEVPTVNGVVTGAPLQQPGDQKANLIAHLAEIVPPGKIVLKAFDDQLNEAYYSAFAKAYFVRLAMTDSDTKLSDKQLDLLHKDKTQKAVRRLRELVGEERRLTSEKPPDVMWRPYDKIYSEQQLRDLLSFCTTPLGRKLLRIQPDLQEGNDYKYKRLRACSFEQS